MAIPLDCPHCKDFRGRPHELYLHLRDQGFDRADAKRITNKQLNDWKEIEIQKLQQNKSADQLKQKRRKELEEYEKEYLKRIEEDDSKNNSDGTSQFCTECGNTLIHNAKFCGSCGTKITS